MTTPTPTAEEIARGADPTLAGLPDTGTLARWANELFAAVRPGLAGA